MFGTFFEQDRLLNLIILGVYVKRWPKYAGGISKTETDVAQNLTDDFFLTLTVRGTFHRMDFKWKKIGGTGGYFLKKMEVWYAELNERVEAAASSYSAAGDFLQNIYSAIMAKNHQKIQSRCLVHEFSVREIF